MTETQRQFSMLVVDDDAIYRDLIEESLKNAFPGVFISSANDGAEGVDRCQAQTFDLIVSDFKMPRLTGMEMLACIRRAQIHTPAIVASSSDLPAGNLTDVGAFLFLPKHELHLLPDLAARLLGSRAA